MKKIAIRTCIGCASSFDRQGVINNIKAKFADDCEFKYSYDASKDSEYDLILLVNGCESACAAPVEAEGMKFLEINGENHAKAMELFEEML